MDRNIWLQEIKLISNNIGEIRKPKSHVYWGTEQLVKVEWRTLLKYVTPQKMEKFQKVNWKVYFYILNLISTL